MTLDSEFELALGRNAKQWDEKVESLARNLCFMKGEDPDLHVITDLDTNGGLCWEYYQADAETFLANEIMRDHYDDNFAWKMPYPSVMPSAI